VKDFARPSCRTILLAAVTTFAALPAQANDMTTEWATVKAPPVPQLKAATVDPKTTALLILDLMKGNCGARPRCAASVPNVKNCWKRPAPKT
jgi:hypothetical protein